MSTTNSKRRRISDGRSIAFSFTVVYVIFFFFFTIVAVCVFISCLCFHVKYNNSDHKCNLLSLNTYIIKTIIVISRLRNQQQRFRIYNVTATVIETMNKYFNRIHLQCPTYLSLSPCQGASCSQDTTTTPLMSGTPSSASASPSCTATRTGSPV